MNLTEFDVAVRLKGGGKHLLAVSAESEEIAVEMVNKHFGLSNIAVVLVGQPSTGSSNVQLGEATA